MCNSTRKGGYVKRPLPENVAVEWVTVPPETDGTLTATVLLNSTVYGFSRWIDHQTGEVLGYRFARPDGVMRDLDHALVCDCQDATYRGRRCKHSYAVQKLLVGLDAARQAQLDAEQAADREDLPGWTDAELDALWRESLEDEAMACGRWLEPDEIPEPFRFGVGA